MRLHPLLKPLAYLAGCLLYAVPDWLTDEFGSVSIDQVLYHLNLGTEGLLSSDPELLVRFLWRGVALPVALALVLWTLDTYVRYLRAHPEAVPMRVIGPVMRTARRGGARAGELLRRTFRRALPHALPLVVFGAGAAFFIDSFSLASYVRTYFGEDYFSGSYVDPRHVTLRKEKPKSLVLIYVESLENTYSDPALFGRDLLERLNAYKSRAITFDDYRQMPGAHFTIAGIVATQCGLPLKSVALFGGNTQGEQIDRFLPRAHCLGDILAGAGYTNVFLNGSSLVFGGVGNFFRDHHYAKVLGREEWVGLGEKPETMSGWGLHDDDLFRRARDELGVLMKAKRPFNLTVLTIDTHHPYGHLSSRCAREGRSDFDGIVECTAGQVADFIDHIAAKGWMDRVAIVVQGDHLAMGNTSYDKLVSNPHRTIFNLLIGGDRKLVKNTDEVTHFDMLPTMLDLVGLRVEGQRAGLGYSAIGPVTVPRPADRLARMEEQLMNYSAAYRELWELPPTPDGAPMQLVVPDHTSTSPLGDPRQLARVR
ncbi:sulfatase-like hydrolase/transferase [Aromatoleum buckelii]|uniref:Sulfatase-like hydrolase/transferase n=1 Tax=Aromatoleum buckelii TaxID=200254 RepID=A0ABX1N1S7_9RHOO|nr:sulfatase-like hydrolase/transferase [Aromatoleum buckelii]MCK0510338.1 sulfatase-like hydrolase/transferase [Aromatoleum buckelii]